MTSKALLRFSFSMQPPSLGLVSETVKKTLGGLKVEICSLLQSEVNPV